ncbi:DUF4062 domain-containing protein [Paraburkholderia sp. Ac-20340]|uniref:DUF4062 domain-containing protein n=1 Tax=Paraburkholderia sp. Ac-20340 TaxID=2703888 RepID=UPI00197EE00A|nr:DUF4062 domain-containing protein [Paraburkholderia sp. Ac-20340]MBN3854386.1 DUF4062 domain-containing protein [Paraburkholderia sp. Ac-20340]
MPRISTIVQVFVASPSDVAPEREALETLIAEMNRTWSAGLGIMFELVRWETHVTPMMGGDPQSLINGQIGDDYDVFIGILWARFGTPTPRAMSGTQEEFERAYARLSADQNAPLIMFYFKEAAIPISRIDPRQIESVQKFRSSLSDRGIYSTFEDLDAFVTSVRGHLSAVAQRFARQSADPIAIPAPPKSVELSIEPIREDDLGLLDYVEICNARIEDMVAAMEVIEDATERVSVQFTGHTAALTELTTVGTSPSPKTVKRLIKRCADDMEAFAGILKSQTMILSLHRQAAFDALDKSLTLSHEINAENNSDLQELYESLSSLQRNLGGPMHQLTGFKETTAALPKMTSDLNKAKRLVVGQLDALIEELEKTGSTTGNVLLSIERML